MANPELRADEHPRHLCDLDLQYQPGQDAYSTAEGKLGGYIGSGQGRVEGTELKGNVTWDLYERSVGDFSCDSNFVGVIQTDDGAEISFDSKGFARVLDLSNTNKWTMHMGIKFQTEDPG